jgi:hypothetical protein
MEKKIIHIELFTRTVLVNWGRICRRRGKQQRIRLEHIISASGIIYDRRRKPHAECSALEASRHDTTVAPRRTEQIAPAHRKERHHASPLFLHSWETVGGLPTGHLQQVQLWLRNMDMGTHVYCQSVASQLAKCIRKEPIPYKPL